LKRSFTPPNGFIKPLVNPPQKPPDPPPELFITDKTHEADEDNIIATSIGVKSLIPCIILRKYTVSITMYEVYTDGSCLGNPGRGGWGVVSDKFKLCAGQPNTTNNQMEMTAIVKALEECLRRNYLEVRIYTDSNYVKNGITQWIYKWKKNGWKTSSGGDVKNKELWIRIDTLRDQMNDVDWKWVKAHNGNPLNEEVDKLARNCAEKIC
jgi:ribonuclease HI